MKKISLFASLLSGFIAFGQAEDKELIKGMCGCYKVDFEYAETFSDAKDYEFRDRYEAHGLEWAFVDEESDDKVVIQHLLVINDSTIVKHWRQDWLYENRDLFTYQRNLEWKKESIPAEKAEGTWTQKVYQVDDSPRYQGYAHWVDLDGRKYWESQVYAPLPRREYTKRSDYNVMLRNNKHKITDFGHVHELDNAKVIRTEGKDSILVWEKGMNTYTKVEDSQCEAAVNWWKENRAFWVDVRTVWQEIAEEKDYINIAQKVDNKRLWQDLFALGKEYAGDEKYNSKKVRKEIRKTIDPFLSETASPWTTARAGETEGSDNN